MIRPERQSSFCIVSDGRLPWLFRTIRLTESLGALVFSVVLCTMPFTLASAQNRFLPSAVGINLGAGVSFPRALEAGSCERRQPVVGGLWLGWTPSRFIQFQATASRFGGGVTNGTCVAPPCPPTGPCPRAEGMGREIKPVGVRLLIEPVTWKVPVSPQFSAGAGRLIGDGENYATIGAGFRYGRRSGPSLTLEFERFFFHAPVNVFDHRSNELLSTSRESTTMNLLRLGFEWRR